MNEWATNKLISAKTVQEAKDALSAGANLHFKREYTKITPIMLMLKNKAPYEVINFVVSVDPSIVNELDADDTLPVVYALRYMAKPAVTELLINKTTNIDQQDTRGDTPLIYAFRHGAKHKIKKLLVNKTKNIDAQSRNNEIYNSYFGMVPGGRTALMEACRSGCNTEALDALIKKGANVNAEDEYGWTPLWYAVYHGNVATVKYLLKNGAIVDLNKKDKYRFYWYIPKGILSYTGKSATIRQLLLEYAQKQSNNKLHDLVAKQAGKTRINSK